MATKDPQAKDGMVYVPDLRLPLILYADATRAAGQQDLGQWIAKAIAQALDAPPDRIPDCQLDQIRKAVETENARHQSKLAETRASLEDCAQKLVVITTELTATSAETNKSADAVDTAAADLRHATARLIQATKKSPWWKRIIGL